jgi:hypothetical protein
MLWLALWSAMLVVAAINLLGPALCNHVALVGGKWGLLFSLLLALAAGIQVMGGIAFLRRRDAGLAALVLVVFFAGQAMQCVRSMGPGTQNRGVDFSAYYLAGKLVSQTPASTSTPSESLYQLPLYDDGRMNLNSEVVDSSLWHSEAARYHLPFAAPFIYPPFVAVMMKPFTLLSFASAYRIWSLFSLLMMIAAAWLALDVGGVKIYPSLTLILGVGIFSFYPLLDNLFYGQMGGVILFLFAATVWLLARGRDWLSALCLAVATLVKLTPMLAVPVLVFHRRWRWLAAYAVWLIALTAVSVQQAGWAAHGEFLHRVLPSISCGTPVCQNSSIAAVVEEWFMGRVPMAQNAPASLPAYACAVSRVVAFAVYVLMLTRCYRRRREGLVVNDMIAMALLGIVISPISWWHHYTLGLLAFLYLLGKRPARGGGWLLLLFFAVATNFVGIIRILVTNHAVQLLLAPIIPALTIAAVYAMLAPEEKAANDSSITIAA